MTRRRIRLAAATTAGLLLAAGGLLTALPAHAGTPTTTDIPFLAPYYTELDVTGDHQITPDDLAKVAAHLGTTSADPDWSAVSAADADHDGVITLADLATESGRMVYDDGPFTLVGASLVDMQAAMNAHVITSVQLTHDYLDRIAALDTTKVDPAPNGRPLHSIISTGAATALAAAADADADRAAHGMTSLLLGVPIALKDNYDTRDMPTTGGCGCWDANDTGTDATMVADLRKAGAVIMAKASLDEFAFGFVSEYSSFQPAGTSTLVASPYNTSQTAGGSSGGTGAAISANLAGLGFGTDTGGSIRVPSSYNQLVGIRPTVGLTSRDGIIPLALSQDTGGPIARSVTDAAVALDAVVGTDPADPITQEQVGHVPTSYTAALNLAALQGARIGYVPSMVGTNVATVRLWNQALSTLQAQGATIVPLTPPSDFSKVLAESSGSNNEFKHDLDAYIANHLAPGVQARSLQGILASGRYVPSRQSTYQSRDLVTDSQYQAWAGPTGSHALQLAAGDALVTQMMNDNSLDSIVYPTANPYGTIGQNLRLSPNTGMPAITVPMGQSIAADNLAVGAGAGVNLEFLGHDYAESTIIGLAYAFEQATHARTSPVLYGPLP